MKLALAIAGDNARPDAFVVFRGFERSIRRAAALGYRGVELALKSSGEIDAAWLGRLLADMGMGVSCISTGQVYADTGLSLTDGDERRRLRAIDTFRGMIDLAEQFGQTVNIGRARGRIDGRDPAAVRGLFRESLNALAAHAAPKGVTLVIEPVNRYEIDFLNSVEEAAHFVREANIGCVKIMPDLFHMNIEDADLCRTLSTNIDIIGYIHLADSNRLAPGQGHTRFDDMFATLRSSGYSGWLGVEILPKPDPDTAATQAANFLLPYLDNP